MLCLVLILKSLVLSHQKWNFLHLLQFICRCSTVKHSSVEKRVDYIFPGMPLPFLFLSKQQFGRLRLFLCFFSQISPALRELQIFHTNCVADISSPWDLVAFCSGFIHPYYLWSSCEGNRSRRETQTSLSPAIFSSSLRITRQSQASEDTCYL